MIEFTNLALLGAAAAVSVPVLVHLLHRRRMHRVDWGAMRFLLEMLARRRRRMLIENWLLLLLRMGVIALLVAALLRPVLIDAERADLAVARQDRVAAILLVDDSVSAGHGREETAWERMRRMALAYLDGLRPGDEVSIIRSSRIHQPLGDPLFDLAAARDIVRSIEPTATGSDIPALLAKAAAAAKRHINADVEFVLVNDGMDDGWHPERRALWSDLRQRLDLALAGGPGGGDGRDDGPAFIHLAPKPAEAPENLALESIALDRSLVPPGTEIHVKVGLRRTGDDYNEKARLRLVVDGEIEEERELGILPQRRHELVFPHRFPEPGSHAVTVSLHGTRDALSADDAINLAVEVVESVRVLLVDDAPPGAGIFERPSGMLEAALQPRPEDEPVFRLRRIGGSELADAELDDHDVVVLCDVAALAADAVADLESYVVAGGSVWIGLGPRTDLELVNRYWARDGDGFLPAPLLERRDPPEEIVPGFADLTHPALRSFQGEAAEEWKRLRIGCNYRLDLEGIDASELDHLLRLANGDPLLLARERGEGKVMLWTSSFDLTWADPACSPFVPLVRGVVGHLAAEVTPPRNLRPLQRLAHEPRGPAENVVATDAEDRAIPLRTGLWKGRGVLRSEELTGAGIVRVEDGGETIYYAVRQPSAESRLVPVTEETVSTALGGYPVVRLVDAGRVTDLFAGQGREGVQLWRLLLGLAVALLFVESWVTRRQTTRDRGRIAGAEEAGAEEVADAA